MQADPPGSGFFPDEWSVAADGLTKALGRSCAQSRRKDTDMLKTYQGSCHCGAVKIEAELDLTQSSYRCNCSVCRRTRFWPVVAKPEGFRLLSGEAELTQYLFNTRKNRHCFCKHCGVRVFGVGTETPVGMMYGVNLGCLKDVSDEDLSRVPITYVDGRNDRFSAPQYFSHL